MSRAATEVDLADLPADGRYRLLSGLVVPRPIAWIVTRSASGDTNLAPFSFFNVVCTDPPLLVVAIDDRDADADGSADAASPDRRKDTLRNLEETRACVVHVVDEAHVDTVAASAIAFPAGVSEPEAIGVELVEPDGGGVPYVASAPAALRCRLDRVLRLGPATTLVFLAVVGVRLRGDVWSDGRVDASALAAVGRMSGGRFASTRETWTRTVPSYEAWRRGRQDAVEPSGPNDDSGEPSDARKRST